MTAPVSYEDGTSASRVWFNTDARAASERFAQWTCGWIDDCCPPVFVAINENLYSPKNGRNNNELTNSTNKQQKSKTNYDANSKCQW